MQTASKPESSHRYFLASNILALSISILGAAPEAGAADYIQLAGSKDFYVESILTWDGVVYVGTQDNGVQTMGPDGQNLKSSLDQRGRCLDAQGSKVYVGTDDGVHLSEDKGTTWRRLGNMEKDESVLSLAVKGDTLFAGTFLGLYVSRDGGAKWERTGADRIQSWTQAVAVSGNLVYAGSGDMFTGSKLSRSEDGGKTWVAAAWNGSGREITGIRFTGSYLHVATNSGLNFSPDKGTTWTISPAQSAVNKATSFFDATLGATDGALFFATDRIPFVSLDNGLTWSNLKTPPFGYTVFTKAGANLWVGTGNGLYSGVLTESIPVRPAKQALQAVSQPGVRRGPGGAVLARAEGGWTRMDGRRPGSAPIR